MVRRLVWNSTEKKKYSYRQKNTLLHETNGTASRAISLRHVSGYQVKAYITPPVATRQIDPSVVFPPTEWPWTVPFPL